MKTKKIPRTPKERAADLAGLGATVEQLPNSKRGEYRITCPKCGGIFVDDRGFWVLTAEQKAHPGFRGIVSLADVKRPGYVFMGQRFDATVASGDMRWITARAHIIGCSGKDTRKMNRDEREVERRDFGAFQSCLREIHHMRWEFEQVTPEQRAVLKLELALVLAELDLQD